jgi:hypothetical protein
LETIQEKRGIQSWQSTILGLPTPSKYILGIRFIVVQAIPPFEDIPAALVISCSSLLLIENPSSRAYIAPCTNARALRRGFISGFLPVSIYIVAIYLPFSIYSYTISNPSITSLPLRIVVVNDWDLHISFGLNFV